MPPWRSANVRFIRPIESSRVESSCGITRSKNTRARIEGIFNMDTSLRKDRHLLSLVFLVAIFLFSGSTLVSGSTFAQTQAPDHDTRTTTTLQDLVLEGPGWKVEIEYDPGINQYPALVQRLAARTRDILEKYWKMEGLPVRMSIRMIQATYRRFLQPIINLSHNPRILSSCAAMAANIWAVPAPYLWRKLIPGSRKNSNGWKFPCCSLTGSACKH